MNRLELIDFFKGYSIFTIVIYHYLQHLALPNPFSTIINFGGTGVHLFVLLSGFGLFLSYQNRPIAYFKFVKKRFSKVYIPYIIIVLLTASVSLFIPIFPNSLYALGGHVFLYKMFDNSIIASYGYPLWFISMIMQFYLVFHALVYLKKQLQNRPFIIITALISISWPVLVMLLHHETNRAWNSFFLQYLWEFALGMVLASLYNHHKLKQLRTKSIYFLISIIACTLYALLAILGGEIGKLFNDIPALIGYSTFALFLYLIKNKLVNRFFVFTGTISYSLYLFHILIVQILLYFSNNEHLVVVLTTSLIISYTVSIYFQKLVSNLYKTLSI